MFSLSNSEKDSFENYGKQTLASGAVNNSPNIFVADSANELRELRQLTPPLPFTVRAGQVKLIDLRKWKEFSRSMIRGLTCIFFACTFRVRKMR